MHPNQLADLVISGTVLRHASVALLYTADAPGGTGRLTVERGFDELVSIPMPTELIEATAARIALLSGLHLGGESEAIGRLRLRVAGEVAELLTSLRPTQHGLSLELRPIAVGGRPILPVQPLALSRCGHCAAYYPSNAQTCEQCDRALTPVEDDARAGGTVGPYRIDAIAGTGGMGIVYLGTHALIGRPVAVKVLHESLLDDPSMASRFLIEARAASRLHHPAIVDVTDYGLLGDGRPYLVMERLTGISLLDHLRRESFLAPRTALMITRQLAEALDHAHQYGVIHQDLKPANVFLLAGSPSDAPVCKLIDFGASRAFAPDSKPEQLADQVLGTPSYMSPEHARGAQTDARSDLYSLGILLYEQLSGHVPFSSKDPMEVLRQHVFRTPEPVESPLVRLPSSVVALVARLLRKKPADRHQSGAELVREIDECLAAMPAKKSRFRGEP